MVVANFSFEAEKKQLSLHVKGHAGANYPGHDIICAASSILAYTIGQEVKIADSRGILKYHPTIKLKEGDAIITCRAKDDDALAELLVSYRTVQSGYAVLAHNYPQYVAVEMFGESE